MRRWPGAIRGERAKLAITAASVAGFRRALDGLGFTEISTPKIVASATESGANVFALDYFGRQAYLAQSPQFYKQTMVGVFERVYETGQVFRAEPHELARHLAEYTSLDAELGFIRDHFDVMAVVREAVAGMVEGIRERACPGALGRRCRRCRERFPWVHFSRRRARSSGRRRADLAPADERWLGDWARSTAQMAVRDRLPARRSGRSTRIPSPDGPSTRTRSTCSSAEWSS